MVSPNSVYDSDADERPIHRESSGADKSAQSSGGADQKKVMDRNDLSGAEENSLAGRPSDSKSSIPSAAASLRSLSAGSGISYNQIDKLSGVGKIKGLLQKTGQHKKGIIGGSSLLIGILGIIIALTFLLIPLKIKNIVHNLENHFFASSEQAVKKENEKLLASYLSRHYLKSKCAGVVDRNCKVPIKGLTSNPVTNLYKSWSNARLEDDLATNYGIEFKRIGNDWFLKAPGTKGLGDNIGPNGENLESDFNKTSRAGMRSAIDDAMQNETKWKQVFYRYKVGRLLEEKYGIKRCIVFCNGRDALDSLKGDIKTKARKTASRIFYVNRVIQPRNLVLGIAMSCLFDVNCHPTPAQPVCEGPTDVDCKPPCTSGVDCELSGDPENPRVDTPARETLEQNSQREGSNKPSDVQQEVTDSEEPKDKTTERSTLLAKALDKLGAIDGINISQELIGKVDSGANALSLVNTISQVIQGLNGASTKIKKLAWITNAAGAVSMYTEYRTYADELQSGHINATELGSFVDSLGPKASADVGGTAGAEAAPLYNNYINGTTGSTTTGNTPVALLNVLLPPANADSSEAPPDNPSGTYLCKNHKPTAAACPEELIGLGGGKQSVILGILNKVHQFFTTTAPGQLIKGISDLYSNTVGKVFTAAQSITGAILSTIISAFPLLQDVTKLIGQILKPVLQYVVAQVIPDPYTGQNGGNNISGGRRYQIMAAGADVSANDTAHNSLGGIKMTDQQVSVIQHKQATENQIAFQRQPLFAQLFSTNSQNSLISKLALDIPTGDTSYVIRSSFADLLSNPFGKVFSGFSSIFSKPVSADSTPQPDPFGVPQYGYPGANLNEGDPEDYWNAHCDNDPNTGYQNLPNHQDYSSQSSKKYDPLNSMPVNDNSNGGVDPCMLIMGSVGSTGGYFDSSNLTADDLGDANNSSGSGP